MKRFSLIILIAVFLISAMAYNSNAVTVAFVNLKKVMQDSNMGKAAKEQIKALIQAKKIVIKKKETKLKEIIKKLKSKKLSKKEKKKLQNEYTKAMVDLQQYQAQASQEVRKKEIEETNKILSKAVNVIKNYAKKRGIDAVFETSQGSVVYWNDNMDITKTIIELMNKSENASKK